MSFTQYILYMCYKLINMTHIHTHLSISPRPAVLVIAAMYLMMILDASVFPAPLSPITAQYNHQQQVDGSSSHQISRCRNLFQVSW